MATSSRALLVAAGGGIGDTLLAGVVAHALRTRYDDVDALVLPAHVTIAEHDPVYRAVLAFQGSATARRTQLRAREYDAAVVTWATTATALAPFTAGIPVRVGQSRRLYSRLFTERVEIRSEDGDRTTHWTQILLDYARAIGCDDRTAQPVFVPTDADRNATATLLHAIGAPRDFGILHPTRGLSAAHVRWPSDGFIALANALHAREGMPFLITGAAADRDITATIAAATRGVAQSIAGATTIGTFAALAERARYVIAMDSGPMHVAAAVGAPTVGIFALQSDEPDRWAPRGAHTAVVRATFPCPPGHRKETCPDFACVRALDIAGVLRALDGLRRAIGERS